MQPRAFVFTLLLFFVAFKGRFGEEEGSDEFGGTVMVHPRNKDSNDARARLSYVELTLMGQAFRLGRYPVHFHIAGDVQSKSYVRGCAIHRSFNRQAHVQWLLSAQRFSVALASMTKSFKSVMESRDFISVSKVSSRSEGFRSRALRLETLHGLFLMKLCKKEFLKNTVLKNDCSKFCRSKRSVAALFVVMLFARWRKQFSLYSV